MKKIVTVLGVCWVVLGGIGAIGAWGQSVTTGILLFLAVAFTGVPFFALAATMDRVEELQRQLEVLTARVHRKADLPPDAVAVTPKEPPLPGGRRALTPWTCQKCGAGNKADTDRCDNCGAAY